MIGVGALPLPTKQPLRLRAATTIAIAIAAFFTETPLVLNVPFVGPLRLFLTSQKYIIRHRLLVLKSYIPYESSRSKVARGLRVPEFGAAPRQYGWQELPRPTVLSH